MSDHRPPNGAGDADGVASSASKVTDGEFPGYTTLSEARAHLHAHWVEGTTCPCCRQRVQLYRRTITSGMALALMAFAREDRRREAADPAAHAADPFIHAEDLFKRIPGLPRSARGDFTKLRYWGLIIPAEGRREDGSSRNGYWAITNAGHAFAGDALRVTRYVYLYNNERYNPPPGAREGTITIREALGSRFDYDQLVRGPWVNDSGKGAAAVRPSAQRLPSPAGRVTA